MKRSPFARPLLALPLLAVPLPVAVVPAGAASGPPDAPPAIGYDWMGAAEAGLGPDVWPRGDASAAGLDDMILDERNAILDRDPLRGPGLVRFARRLSGDYVVVPLFRLRFRRGG